MTTPASGERRSAGPLDHRAAVLAGEAINALASRQHGVVTRQQLLAAGIARGVVDRRVKSGWLRPVHRGVYVVGAVMARHAKEIAACLACGPAAIVSHRSAAVLWQLLQGPAAPATVDVIIPAGVRRRPGIRIHRRSTLRSDEVTRLEGIPITTPARTLYDLAGSVAPRDLERALAQALARGVARPNQIRSLLRHHPGRPGEPELRALLEGGGPALTRSEAEDRFLSLIRKAQLGAPATNVEAAGHEVDFLWRTERLVVEIDGFAFHSSPGAFERDRRRDAMLAAAGLRVVRVTWRQLLEEPEAVLARLAQALVRPARS